MEIIETKGDWGLGIGDWGFPIPNPQSPIPNSLSISNCHC